MTIFRIRQTVDGIIADITNKIEQLRVVAEAHKLEAEVHDAVVADRQALAEWARKQEARAKAIGEKLAALVS